MAVAVDPSGLAHCLSEVFAGEQIKFERKLDDTRIASVHLKTRLTQRFAFEGGGDRAKANKPKRTIHTL